MPRRFLTLDDIDVGGKRVLLRADLNVPVKDGRVTDATRIERLAPTIVELLDNGAAVIVMSHFGRPKGPDPAVVIGFCCSTTGQRTPAHKTAIPRRVRTRGPVWSSDIADLAIRASPPSSFTSLADVAASSNRC